MKKFSTFFSAFFLFSLIGHAQAGIYVRPGLTAQKRFVIADQTKVSEALEVGGQFGMGLNYLFRQGESLVCA
ncbi:MAG: hypothetical protein ACK4NS_03645 [Saprospiraceae bacterium]